MSGDACELGKVIELRYEIFLFNAKFLQALSLFSEWLACGGFGRWEARRTVAWPDFLPGPGWVTATQPSHTFVPK